MKLNGIKNIVIIEREEKSIRIKVTKVTKVIELILDIKKVYNLI